MRLIRPFLIHLSPIRKSNRLACIGLLAGTLSCNPTHCEAATISPVIFNHSKSVNPGQIISIQGANFGANPEVWIDQIVDNTDTPNPETKLTNIVNKSDTLLQGSYVAAEIPTSVPLGLYAIFVKNTATGLTGTHKFVNRASASMALDLAGTEIDPSRTFRLMGINLNFTATTTSVKFKKPDGTTVPATFPPSQPNDPYLLTVISPASLTAGTQYEIVVNNGYGGTTYGDVATGVFLTARAAGTDPFNLNVPWASDFSALYNNTYNVTNDPRLTLHAIPNDGLDDRAAINGAINAAHTAGGGRVYLPAGTYDVKGANISLQDKQRVVIHGAGKTLTKIYCDEPLSGYVFSGFGGANTMSYVGFADFGLEVGPNGPSSAQRLGASNGVKSFIVRCKYYNKAGTIGATGVLIQDNEFNSGAIGTRHRDMLYRGNFITWKNGRLNFYSDGADSANPFCDRLQFDSNTFSRSVLRTDFSTGAGGLSLGGAHNVAVINNTFDRLEKTGTYANTKLPENNDGETLMNENYEDSHNGVGPVTGASDTTLVDTNKTFGSGQVNWFVTIIQGPGTGQTRKITAASGSQLTVSPAWDVNPTTSSNYAIDKWDDNYLVKGNTFRELNRALWLCYSGTMGNVSIVSNNLVDTGGIYVLGMSDAGWWPGRFNILKDILIEGNTLSSTRSPAWYSAQITIAGSLKGSGGDQIWGNHFYNTTVRNNTLAGSSTDPGDGGGTGFAQGYWAKGKDLTLVDDDSTSVHGVLFDGNTASNLSAAYRLDTRSHSTTIWNSVNTSVANVVGDTVNNSASSHASVNTAVAWSTTSSMTPPIVSITAVGVNPTEGTANIGKFRFTRNGTAGSLIVSYTKSTNSAVAGDYTPALGTSVTIPSGSISADVDITAVNDSIVEGLETLTLTLNTSSAYRIGNPNATLTIADNDMLLTKQDIGAVEQAGSFSAANSLFTVTGDGSAAGTGIQGTADAFLFASQPLVGNGSITARLTSFAGGNGGWQHLGIMIRESSAAGSRYAMVKIAGGANVRMSRRYTLNGSASDTSNVSITNPNTTPRWMRLTRAGQVFTAQHSTDGATWLTLGTADMTSSPMSNSAYAGLAVSGITGPCTATFDNVAVVDGSAPLSRTPWTVSASHNSSTSGNAKDGTASTRWTTGIVQAPTPAQWYRINMGSQQSFSKIVLDSTGSPDDSPASYVVNGSNDGTTWTTITSGTGVAGITTVTFPTQNYQHVRIDQVGSKAGKWWSIHELNVYP